MGERKVLNKYYPPDFDPSSVPRRKMPKDRQYKVRLMAPFNMRCTTCGEYIYKGKKFNAMKVGPGFWLRTLTSLPQETVQGEDYLGIRIFRFHIRCTRCCGEISFRTDPRNTDYQCEAGATRNFETWRVADVLGTTDLDAEAEQVEANPMEVLENRTKESRQEMDILDALEEIKDNNARKVKVDIDGLLQERLDKDLAKIKQQREEEEALVAAAFGEKNIKRLPEEDHGADEFEVGGFGTSTVRSWHDKGMRPNLDTGDSITDVLVSGKSARKRKADDDGDDRKKSKSEKPLLAGLVRPKSNKAAATGSKKPTLVVIKKKAPAPAPASSALGGLAAYGSDSDSD